MNGIYLSYGIQSFAAGLISLFVPVYLYKLGYSIPMVMLYYFFLPIYFVIFAYGGAKLVASLGVKRAMLASIVMEIVLFLGWRGIDYQPMLFYILPPLHALKTMFFAYSFHLNVLDHSDQQHRGRQVSALQFAALAGNLLAPMFGGLVIYYSSFSVLFILGSLILLSSMLPLTGVKAEPAQVNFSKYSLFSNIFKKQMRPLAYSYSGYAIEDWIGYVLWPIFLTVILVKVESIGLISSLTAIISFLLFYLLGHLADRGDRRSLIKITTWLYFLGWIGRMFANSFGSVLVIDSYKKISGQALQVPWSAYSYDLAAKTNHFKFIVEREIIFDLSRVIVIPFVILIFIININPFFWSFLVAAIASLFYMALSRATAEAELPQDIKIVADD